ncbi:hypothetical protein J6590_030620 [Homalodisca vitripennis]|nr:hypothetical protein J6590_030620 [Homalodisca vitripennis]
MSARRRPLCPYIILVTTKLFAPAMMIGIFQTLDYVLERQIRLDVVKIGRSEVGKVPIENAWALLACVKKKNIY